LCLNFQLNCHALNFCNTKSIILPQPKREEARIMISVTIGAWASAGLVVLDLQGGALKALDGPLLQQMLFAIHRLNPDWE